jgi:hypothetical protein
MRPGFELSKREGLRKPDEIRIAEFQLLSITTQAPKAKCLGPERTQAKIAFNAERASICLVPCMPAPGHSRRLVFAAVDARRQE